MRIPLLSAWLEARRFDREHRPYLEARDLGPRQLPDGRLHYPGLQGIWCRRHNGWFGECPA